MSNKQKKGSKGWLSNLVSVCTLITLFLIMAQVFLTRRANIETSEWEKAKVTIENIERFKENLKETALYGKTEALRFSTNLFPDLSTPEGYKASDTLRKIYWSLFDDELKMKDDFEKSLAILNAFAYPIIMGYASEMGSYQSVMLEYSTYSNYIMPGAFHGYQYVGLHAKLLHRLWRVKFELIAFRGLDFDNNEHIEELEKNINNLLCFEGTEITPASLKEYEKKLDKELKKIQKEIEVFRKSSLK